VARQERREKELQKRFYELKLAREELEVLEQRDQATLSVAPVRYDQPDAGTTADTPPAGSVDAQST